MRSIIFNFCDASVTTSDPSVQNVTALTGTMVANATDIAGAATGISLSSSDSLNASTTQQKVIAISPFIKEVCDYYLFGFGEGGGTFSKVLSGFDPDELVGGSFVGFRGGNTRSTSLTINGNTYTYSNNGDTSDPTPAIEFTEFADESGNLVITYSSPTLEVFYLSGLRIDFDGAAKITPANMTDGETGVALNPVGLGTITSWKINGVATTGTDTTINNLDISTLASESGVLGPNIGENTIEVSDGVSTVSAKNTNSAKAGYDSVDIVTPDTVSPLALYALMSNLEPPLTLATDDTFYYPTANDSVINEDGTYNVSPVPYNFSYQDDTDGKWYSMTITTTGGGGETSGTRGITARDITARDITIQDLTARDLL